MTELIGRRKISPKMGSSLLNDGAYAQKISTNLVLAAQTLFGAGERDLLHAAKTVSLDDNEREVFHSQSELPEADDGLEKNGIES